MSSGDNNDIYVPQMREIGILLRLRSGRASLGELADAIGDSDIDQTREALFVLVSHRLVHSNLDTTWNRRAAFLTQAGIDWLGVQGISVSSRAQGDADERSAEEMAPP